MNPLGNRIVEQVARRVNTGHARRNASVVRHVQRLIEGPRGKNWAEAKSWYELLDNPKVSVEALRELRRGLVRDELPAEPDADVLILHDLSPVDYTRQSAKADRRAIGDGGGLGYEYHACLAMDPHTERFLGIVHDTLISRDGPDDANWVDYRSDPLCATLCAARRATLPENHRHQLAMHIRRLAAPDLCLWGKRRVLHVADREFDDVPAMVAARAVHQEFVFRALGNRTVEVPVPETGLAAWEACSLQALIAGLPMRPYKEVALDARGHVVRRERPARRARLSIGACPLRFFRPFTRAGIRNRPLPAPLEANLVVIREREPPPGGKPLCWVLFTSLPIDTPEQRAFVGRAYELRWRIEDYFKLVKSGFGLERARFDNAAKTAKALVFYSLAALALLDLKAALGLPMTGPLDEGSYTKVQRAMRHPEDPDLDSTWVVLAAVLHLGGWLGRRRDPVGPRVLMRGLAQLLTVLQTLQHFPGLLEKLTASGGVHQRSKNTYNP